MALNGRATKFKKMGIPPRGRRGKSLLLWLLVAAGLLTVTGLIRGLTSAEDLILPSDDAFVDINNPNTNFNGQGLDLGYSAFPSFTSAQEIYLKFDLSGITQVISHSVLNLTITANAWEADSNLSVSLYGVEGDGWSQTTVTYSYPPTGTLTLLQTTQVPAGMTGTLSFGSSTVDSPVGEYIESERIGDGSVSFLLRLTGATGTQFAGTSSIEDSEDSQTPGIVDQPVIVVKKDQYLVNLPIVFS